MDIRRYEDTDRDAAYKLHKLALQAAGADAGDGPWEDDWRDVQGAYINSGGEFLVGVEDGRLVAMGALKRWDDTHSEIKRLRVHPDFWRRGFGQAVLKRLEARAAELGFATLHLDTTTSQIAAQRLFEKNGYREVRRGQAGPFMLIDYEKSLVPAALNGSIR